MILRLSVVTIPLLLISAFTGQPNKDIERARAYYEVGDYQNVVYYYERAKKVSQIDDIKKMAQAYTHLADYKKACNWYRYLAKKKPQDESLLLYINSLKSLGRYTIAKEEFKNLTLQAQSDNTILQKSLDSALAWSIKTLPIKLSSLAFNTKYNEGSPMFYQNKLVFCSDREKVLIRKKDNTTHAPMYNFWVSDSALTKANRWDMFINSTDHEGSCSFTQDFSKIYFSRTSFDSDEAVIRPKLYFAEKNSLLWTNKKEFIFNDNNYSLTHPFIVPDESMLLFSADLPGGLGGMDIYVCFNLDGKWTDPINIGEPINTSKNELSPFLATDGILYFSSNNSSGMGGYDIYRAPQKKGKFPIVENMKSPINSPQNDFSFIIDSTNTTGYLSSNRTGTLGGNDVYKIDFTP